MDAEQNLPSNTASQSIISCETVVSVLDEEMSRLSKEWERVKEQLAQVENELEQGRVELIKLKAQWDALAALRASFSLYLPQNEGKSEE